MFDMIKNSGSNNGYRLTIHYNKDLNVYSLTGYIVTMDPSTNKIKLDQDGASIYFNSLEAALKHIAEYES